MGNLSQKTQRSLHADASGTLYVFDDSDAVHRVASSDGAGPCGLAAAVDIPRAEARFAFAADGSVGKVRAPDAPSPECKSLSFEPFGFVGAVAGGVAFRTDGNRAIVAEDLNAKVCTPKPFGTPAPSGNLFSVAANETHVLVLDFHGSGQDDNVVWRYDRAGKLVDKVGLGAEGKSVIRWPDLVATCGPGVCVQSSKELAVFDAAGKLLGRHDVEGEGFVLGYGTVNGLVEVGKPALYLLATFGKGTVKETDLIRLDGVYAK